MKESKRISNLFQNLYDGHPWIDVTLVGNLQRLSYVQASLKIAPKVNSVWEILNHMIEWRSTVLKRVNGEIKHAPENNYFTPIKKKNEIEWQKTLVKLEESQTVWLEFIKSMKSDDFHGIYPVTGFTNYEQIMGILQHDAYHLGQIVVLMRIMDIK